MKTKARTHQLAGVIPESAQAFSINVRSTSRDGIFCSSHTHALGRDRAQAERRFFSKILHSSENDGGRHQFANHQEEA